MAFKDVYCPYGEFWINVCYTETGLIGMMAKEYLTKYMNELKDYPIREYYIPRYPFQGNFSAQCIDSDIYAIRDQYTEYLAQHQDEINEQSELPIFAINHTFDNYFESRLKIMLDQIVDEDYYKEHADDIVISTSDRQQYYIYDPKVHYFSASPHYNPLFDSITLDESDICMNNNQTKEEIRLGECDLDKSPQLLQRITAKLAAGETTIHPFDWIEY